MSDELMVAYVAAAVSLIGLGVNAFTGGINRILDGREKRRSNRVRSIEEYYAPLNTLIDELSYLLNQYKNLVSHSCSTNDLINDLANAGEVVPAKALGMIGMIDAQISKLNNFFINNKYQFYPDYPLKRLHDIICTTISAMTIRFNQEACDKCNNITPNISKSLELFSIRLRNKTVILYTHNPFHWIFPNRFIVKNNILK